MDDFNIVIPENDCKIDTFKRQYEFSPKMKTKDFAEFMGVSERTINRWKLKIKEKTK